MNLARAALAAVTATCAACGNGVPTAPTIESVSLYPETGVRPGEVLTATVVTDDEDGDLGGALAEVGYLRETATEGFFDRVPLPLDGDVTHATVLLDIPLASDAVPGRYDLAIVVLDAATRRSAPYVTQFDVAP